LDRIAHGFAASPVSSTTAADVSSQEVSIPRIRIDRPPLYERPLLECLLERFDVGGLKIRAL